MDHYDDVQVEEFYPADFVEEVYEELFDDEENDKKFSLENYLNSNYDY